MLTAFSRIIGLSRDDSRSQDSLALQRQINELEQNATTLDISRRTNRRTGIFATLGAVGGGVGGYFLSTLTVTVATVAAPVTAAAAGVAAGALALGIGYRMLAGTPKSNHQNTVKKINAISKHVVDNKIKALAETKAGAKIDFIFNKLSEVEEEATETSEKKPVGLVKLDRTLVKNILTSLRRISKHNPSVKIRKIDISSAGLTKRDMANLLSAGLGKHETEHLILSKDDHSEVMVKLLKTYIVDRKTAFQNLKILDLSGNAINESCLDDLKDIVNHLRLKELNLSDNPDLAERTVPPKGHLCLILTDEKNRLASLRKLDLANTGLVEDQAEEVAAFVQQAVFLEELNIDRNDGLNLDEVESQVKEKGAVKSISLEKLVTEYDEHLSMDEVFTERNDILRKIADSKKANESWPIFLINYKLVHKSFPADVAKYLEGTVFNKANIDDLIMKIQIKRREHLGVQEKSTQSITESELIACYEDKLPELYQKVKDKKGASLVDPKLVSQINESKAKQGRVEPATGKVPVPPRTKQTVIKTPRGKVTPAKTKASVKETVKPQTPIKVPAKPQTPVKTPTVKIPNAPITTQFNSARAAKFQADLNATLDADQLARNPGLAKRIARI